MATSSVQFYGKGPVMSAYNSRGVETWGIFQGKQFITGGSGAEQLEEFLTMLEPGGSQAVYTIKVYKDIDDPDSLSDKTECNGSFNFKLFNAMQPASLPSNLPAVVSGPGSADPIYSRVKGIIDEEVAEAVERRLSGTPERETWGDKLMGIVDDAVENPSKYIPLVQAVIGAFRSPAPAPTSAPVVEAYPAKVAGAGAAPALDAETAKYERIAKAVDRLVSFDPNFAEHIEKLANLAEKEPDKYKFALQFL